MPISQKPKYFLHSTGVPSKNLPFLSHKLGQNKTKLYTKCPNKHESESTEFKNMYLTLSKNHIKN